MPLLKRRAALWARTIASLMAGRAASWEGLGLQVGRQCVGVARDLETDLGGLVGDGVVPEFFDVVGVASQGDEALLFQAGERGCDDIHGF